MQEKIDEEIRVTAKTVEIALKGKLHQSWMLQQMKSVIELSPKPMEVLFLLAKKVEIAAWVNKNEQSTQKRARESQGSNAAQGK